MRGAGVRKLAFVLVAALSVASVLVAPSADAASKSKTYKPPWRTGPSAKFSTGGGYQDNATGRMGMLFACTSGRPPFQSFRVLHKVSAKVSSVTVAFDGGVDPSSSIFLEMWTPADRKLGSATLKGPNGAVGGTLTMKPKIAPKKNTAVFVEFGLRGTSCPAVSVSGAQFTSLTVRA
jgi:hypothetical protein